MATATLTFDLTDVGDVLEHVKATKANDMVIALWEFAYNNRRVLKDEIDERLNGKQGITASETLDLVYDSFFEILKSNDLNLDKLIQ